MWSVLYTFLHREVSGSSSCTHPRILFFLISSRIFSCQVEACLDYLYPFITFSSYFSVTTSDILEFEWNIIFHIPWISLLQTNIPASSFLFNASINLIDEVLIFYGYICVFLGNSLDTSSSAPSPLLIDANLDLMLS